MITKLVLAFLLAIPSVAASQDKPADQLRSAIVEEEANHKLNKAIEAYTKIVSQYDENRKVAAIALFHLAECHRKLGQHDRALVAYQRVLQDFGDQTALVEASSSAIVHTSPAASEQMASFLDQILSRLQREQDRMQIEHQFMEKQLKDVEKRFKEGHATNYHVLIAQAEMMLVEEQLRTTDSSKKRFLQLKSINDRELEKKRQ
jgi:tetratricopeptide (TPR) repeat protein